MPTMTESPFAPMRCYPFGDSIYCYLSQHYSALLAHTGSCARPGSSLALCQWLVARVFAGCCKPLLENGRSRLYSAYLSLDAWTLTPVGFYGAFTRSFPQKHRPSPNREQVGFPTTPAQRLRCGTCFRSCSHSFMFRPPALLATQIAPTAVSLTHGSHGFSFPSIARVVTFP